jgi:7,8-dihydropterin-6-yl-methyl-4-(beta-D-ribofuranosyl)aminobenzene 5'-phosphate synthase
MNTYLGSIPRRSLLAGAAGLGLAGSLFSNIRVASAQPLAGTPAPVDRLSIQVITDSYQHVLEPSGKVGDVSYRNYHFMPVPRTLQNEWGLALHFESTRGTQTRRVLADFGFTGDTFNNNIALLGIDPAALDAMLLTHGHYDHFGGMVGFLNAHGKKLKPGLPFILGGEECFCTREVGPAATPFPFGALDRKAIADAGLSVLFAERPSSVAGHGFTTGSIPLVSFEKPTLVTRMKVGVKDGVGCAPEGLAAEKRTVAIVPDDFQHEQATCFNVKDKGLVVVTSCGHRGIVNSVRGAMKVSGIDKAHAVVGGFHLMPVADDYLRSTVMALKELKPDYLIPMHCSGTRFYDLARQEMPGRVLLSSTGTRFTFGA